MKSARDEMDIVNAYQAVGTYRGAAALCGTTHKTVRRVIERRAREQVGRASTGEAVASPVLSIVEDRVRQSDGRISAKRLLPVVRAAGYTGSLRTFQRSVKRIKEQWKRDRRRYRPWVPIPGEHLVIDWASEGGWEIFCGVLAWSRYRFVRFGVDQTRETTLRLLAECFEELGGAPAIVLTDRMACLKAGVVANVVVPHPDYVRFAAHYGFGPDFCESADPESKGVVENLCGYAQRDLLVPVQLDGGFADIDAANDAARAWCAEVNGRVHSEIAAVPRERLATERELLRPLPSLRPPLRTGEPRKVDRTGMVRFGSGRYAVASELAGTVVEVRANEGEVVITQQGRELIRHALVAPGAVALGPYADRLRKPARGVRPRTAAEVTFLGWGAAAETFLRAAAAAGTLRLEAELTQIVALEAAWGRKALTHALERAVRFRRFKASDIRAILAAGSGVATLIPAGSQLVLDLPQVPERPLSAYALGAIGAGR
ncbi:MAG: IS21 family transposase [Actinobacteria bacterium]|nr:MAG: IS21 family transposase [Actinomycetota bacterium]